MMKILLTLLILLIVTSCNRYDRTANNPEATCKSLGFITSESNTECALKIRQTETETYQLYKNWQEDPKILIKQNQLNNSLQLMQKEINMEPLVQLPHIIHPPYVYLECDMKAYSKLYGSGPILLGDYWLEKWECLIKIN